MKDYVLENPASRGALKSIANYELEHFHEDALPYSKMLSLYDRNPYAFSVLLKGGKFSGYFALLSLNERGSKKILGQKEIEEKLTEGDILEPLDLKRASALYLEGIGVVGSLERRRSIAAMLLYGMASYLEERLRLPQIAYAVAATPDGEKLIRSFHAKKIGTASVAGKRRHSFYKISINRPWCVEIKERASKRGAPRLHFKLLRESERNSK